MRRLAADGKLLDELGCACEGVWIPRVVQDFGFGNRTSVGAVCDVRIGIHCPLSISKPRLPKRKPTETGSHSY